MFKQFIKVVFSFSSYVKIGTILLIIALLFAYLASYIHPKSGWIFPFFGLVYPVLLIISFISLIYWLLVKNKKWFLILLLVTLCGIPFMLRLVAFGSTKELPQQAKTSLKILSNNVEIFDLYNEDSQQKYAARDYIFDYAIEQKPDVVCFQEFYFRDEPSDFKTINLFKKRYKAAGSHQRSIFTKRGNQHFGVAIFTTLPVVSKGEVVFQMDDETNYNFSIYMDVVKNKDTFRVYNLHLQSFRITSLQDDTSRTEMIKGMFKRMKEAYPKRANQAEIINEHINRSPYPVIVCGDFNDTPVSYVYHLFSSHLTDAFLNCSSGFGSTYVGKIPAGRIDYIFHDSRLISTNFAIQKEPLTEHRAISCTISKAK